MILPLSALCFGCGTEGSGSSERAHSVWISEAQYQFGDAPGRNVLSSEPDMRVDPLRQRIFILSPQDREVSAWTPSGTFLFAVPRVELPRDVIDVATAVFVKPNGFSIRWGFESQVITHHSESGELERIVPGPARGLFFEGFPLAVYSEEDGTYLGLLRVSSAAELGVAGGSPFSRQPLLRVRATGANRWHDPEPLLWLDFSNRRLAGQLPNDRRVYMPQPFSDADQVRFEPGLAVVMRLKGQPGAAELIEVNAQGDTLWQRRLQFDPALLTEQMIVDHIESYVRVYAFPFRARATPQELREMFRDGLYRPRHLPAAEQHVLTSSGEVWLRTLEMSDTLRTHYVVRRGDLEGEPRRVLLPDWLTVRDATDTHVWGFWHPQGMRPQVVGRRLVPLRD